MHTMEGSRITMRSWKLVCNNFYCCESVVDTSHLKALILMEKLSSLATVVFSGV